MSDPVRAVVVAAHRMVRGAIEIACQESGVTVVGRADTAMGGVSACRTSDPDLLVLELELPDTEGFTVLTELGTERPKQVVVLADLASGDLVLRALQLGASGYVTKADGLRDLVNVIRRVGEGERVMSPALEQGAIRALGTMARRAREGTEVAARLTRRERQVLELISAGLTTGQIASRIGISPRTVESHVAKVYRKLGVRTRVQAVSRAAALGLVDL
ncbi:MAG: LuxR C-terminal-related transcriptional regulator [Actinomycetota bacterium]